MSTNQTIHWMLDESIGNSRPRDWGKVIQMESELVNLIGNDNFKHVLPDPIKGLERISKLLHGNNFSCIFDLTGWLSPSLSELFPSTPIVNSFSLSRVRVVSSPLLATSGYTVSMSQDEIKLKKDVLNLERPLIVDDTTFSGWTNIKTMELWGINPAEATHAFLIANTGYLDDNRQIPGAVHKLTTLGSKIVYGHELSTPDDDGWHLKDLHHHQNLAEAFDMSLYLQKMFLDHEVDSPIISDLMQNKRLIETIFPEFMDKNTVMKLRDGGHFIPSNNFDLNQDIIHTKNPFLWASRYFKVHIDFDRVYRERKAIINTLSTLKELTSDPEAKHEAAIELRNSVFPKTTLEAPDKQFTYGRERL